MRLWTRWLIALAVLLTSCASGPDVRESTEAPEPEWVSSYEEGCEDERSVVLLCAEEECGFFRCRDQQREEVVLARGGVIAPPAAPGDLRTWFEQQGVQNIHNFTLVIPEYIHHRIHGGGARGGRWNDAWRQYKENNPFASPAEIYRHAGELIFRFELAGPLLPYRSR